MAQRVDENYLQRLIDDLQQDHTMLFNTLKQTSCDKDRSKIADKKVDKHTKLLSEMMSKSLQLKTLLATIKSKK